MLVRERFPHLADLALRNLLGVRNPPEQHKERNRELCLDHFRDYTTRVRIRHKPWWLRLWAPSAPIAFFGTIYIPREVRARLEGTPLFDDIVDHEMIHVARQHAKGMVRWHFRYLFDARFRWREEMAAYHSQLRRMRARGDTLSAERRDRLARELSGPKYLFMASRREARAFIDWCLDCEG